MDTYMETNFKSNYDDSLFINAQTIYHYANTNEEVLSAVSKHTAACAEMCVTDALLYIADFTEEGREYEACRAARRLLHDGMARGALPKTRLLRQVLLDIYDASLCALKRLGRPVAKATQEAKEALLANDRYFS